MVEAIRENAIAANFWLIAVMAFFHMSVMALLGIAVWRTLTYRAPLHEEFVAHMPDEHERERHEAATAERPGTVIEVERDKPV